MNYEEMLEQASKLLKVGTKKDIEEFLPDLMFTYDKLDLEATKMADGYENRKDEIYLRMKDLKNKGFSKKTDKDIETESRHLAQEEYGDRNVFKTVVRHFEKYIDQLNSKRISIISDEKNQRELGF